MFNYDNAFSRNIGWVTEQEQAVLKSKRIAIAGAGGVGGEHVVTLARLGIEQFNISDFDEFEVHNFNRQAGAFMSTVGKPKCETMEAIVKDINPEANIKSFNEGIFEHNVDAFLEGVDVYVDSLDFFALEARKCLFKKCEEKRIPIITVAPLGMGAAYLCFMPGAMSFEEYFRFNDVQTKNEQLVKFLIGLSPAMLQREYLVDPSKADFKAQKGPSLSLSVKLCAGIAAANTIKILLGRGDVIAAPRAIHFDAYKNKLVETNLRRGNRGLMQRIKFKVASNIVLK